MLSRTMLMGKMKWGNCKGKNFCEIFVQQLLCFLPSSLGLVQLQISSTEKYSFCFLLGPILQNVLPL